MGRTIALAALVAWLHASAGQTAAFPAAGPGFGGYSRSLNGPSWGNGCCSRS